jgi:hypothetical protein
MAESSFIPPLRVNIFIADEPAGFIGARLKEKER